MPILLAIGKILAPIIAQIGWSLMNERLIRSVCGQTILWIQEEWFPAETNPHASKIMVEAAGYILPPKVVSK